MARTAQQLIQTASKRLGDLILSTPSSPGSTTTLIDALLKQYFSTLTQANIWVYGTSTVDLLNRGVQRRAAGFTRESSTLFFDVTWGEAITTGLYEIHPRYDRSLILEWLNDAIGQLGIYWYREVRDESIETEALTREYTLPFNQYLTKVTDVQIEMNPSGNIDGFPFASALDWNWNAYPYTDQFGNRVWKLQFVGQPPPGRILRIFGEGYYPEMDSDGDVLALGGQYERPALAYVFDWVNFRAKEYDSLIGHTTDTDRSRQKMYDSLNKTREWLTSMLQPTHSPTQIATPGRGDGLFNSGGMQENVQYFGGINGLH